MQNNNYICWQMDGLISRGVKTMGGGGALKWDFTVYEMQ